MMMEMRVDKITIPDRYTRTPPKESKVENHAVYYTKHRQFKKQIVVTQNGWLVDGLCDYIVAVMCGMETVTCEINQQRISHEKQCKRIATTSKRGKRKILYQRQDGKCAICGRALQIDDYTSMENYLTIDHIFPLSRGGVNTIDNLQGLCRNCNSIKSDII